MKISCNRNIHTFMYNKFPELLHQLLIDKVRNYSKERKQLLDNLLKENFDIDSIEELIEIFVKNIRVNNYQDKDYYIIVENVKVGKYDLNSIISTIDYGNSNIPPFNLFNTSLLYINNNLEALYKYTYLGVN